MTHGLALVLFATVTLSAQGQPPPMPRDNPMRPRLPASGTSVIRGRVVAADTGHAIRRATVTLTVTAPPPAGGRAEIAITTQLTTMNGVTQSTSMGGPPRRAITDQQGAFEFTGLAAGVYQLSASASQYAPQYLGMSYGAKRPSGMGSFDPGESISLSDGETFDRAVIALPRGGVISGRVLDDAGVPLARVQVSGVFFPMPARRPMRSANATTDDLGQFRLFGLQPGDYAVAAEPRNMSFMPPGQPDPEGGDRTGFLTTYYPAAADEATAQRIPVRANAETPGIEIRVMVGRLFTLSGFVTDSQGHPVARTSGQLMPANAMLGGGFSMSGFLTDEQGRFQMRSVPAGSYRLIVRPRSMTPGEAPGPEPESAVVPITVAGADLENIVILTSPGVTISGRLAFEQRPPQTTAGLRVFVSPADTQNSFPGLPMPQPATVAQDMTFTIAHLMGEVLLRTSVVGQTLKSVTLNGEDITDTPHAFKQGDRVVLTLTSRVATVEGTVTDSSGKPASAAIVVFPRTRRNGAGVRRRVEAGAPIGRATSGSCRCFRAAITSSPSRRDLS
jgi:protocatechuate 3,4-dioxygenase beta subunit